MSKLLTIRSILILIGAFQILAATVGPEPLLGQNSPKSSGDTVEISPLTMKNTLEELDQTNPQQPSPKNSDTKPGYSILIDPPYLDTDDPQTALQSLKNIGMPCRVSKPAHLSKAAQPPRQVILCGDAANLNDLNELIDIARRNNLNFHVTLTDPSKSH